MIRNERVRDTAMATIKDVAKKAGVTIATVSNVMNGKVSSESETFHLVQEAAKELNYRPNYNAKNLKKGKTRLIGVLLPHLGCPYPDIYRGISKVLEGKEYYPVLKLTENNRLLEKDILESFFDLGVSGIIAVPTETQRGGIYGQVEAKKIPFVAVERRLEGMDCNYVVFDNAALIERCARRLKERYGENRIFLLHQKGYYSADEDCRTGFMRAKAGREENMIAVNPERDEAFKKIYDLLIQKKGQISCVIASTMNLAKAVCEAAFMLKEDIVIYALAGSGWNLHGIYRNIHLIKRDMVMAGMKAAQILAEQEKGDKDISTFYLKQRDFWQEPELTWYAPSRQLHVLALESEATDVMEKLSESVRARYNLQVIYHKKSYEELKKELDREVKSPVCSYDIVMMDKTWLPYYTSQDFLFELRKELGQEMLRQYPDVIRKSFAPYDKRRCVLPVISSIQTIYYRKDCFEDLELKADFLRQFGIPLTPPRNWKEYNMISRFFTREFNPDSPFLWGTAMACSDRINLLSEFYPRQWAFDGTIVDRWGDVVLEQDGNLRALNNLRETYCYSKKEMSYETKDDELFLPILKGEVPMVMGFASHYNPQKYKEQTYEHRLSVVPVPRGKSMLGGYCVGINKKSEHIREACAYLRWMISDKVSIANMRMHGYIPTAAVYSHTGLRMKYPWMNLVSQSFAGSGNREKIIAADGKQILPEAVDEVMSDMLIKALKTDAKSMDLLNEAREKIMDMIEKCDKTF